ncbi:MAG TPA: MSHA biogenesis protein MshJ [Cellvibrio sp.]|nr:MSHA biogenesis protein MshJ [Cellvibrio sp.]
MPPALTDIFEKIDSRVLRERALIFITLLALIFLIWNFLVQARFDREKVALEDEAKRLSSEQQALISKISTLTMALASDPAIIKTNELNKLNANITEVESRLSGLSQGLISAEQLPKVLEDVLARTTSVKLLQVRTLAATELQLVAAKPADSANAKLDAGGTGVYKHGVLIRVAGNYSQLIQLLSEIETLQWKFYWESLDYKVTQYPNAEIDIRVFTLSSEEGLLGV